MKLGALQVVPASKWGVNRGSCFVMGWARIRRSQVSSVFLCPPLTVGATSKPYIHAQTQIRLKPYITNMATMTPLFKEWFPTTISPIIVNAPMHGAANGTLAAEVTKAGGLGKSKSNHKFLKTSGRLSFSLQTFSQAVYSSLQASKTWRTWIRNVRLPAIF